MIAEGMMVDWKKIPNLRLDANWYIQDANKAYTIAGKQYLAVSDITFAGQQNTSILLNIGLVESMKMTSPYTHVENGTWTFDMT